MLSLLKKKNDPEYTAAARAVYAALLARARQPWFYVQAGAPDSFDGRFDLLLLHVFFVVSRLLGEGTSGQAFNQALFDVTFADMDQTLREMGIGDMGVPKHMRRMMKAFNGRMQIYRAALSDDQKFAAALKRNVYGGVDVPAPSLTALMAYSRRVLASLAAQDAAQIMRGEIHLPECEVLS
jgi:cytochrome b pre-mRNA-processing protein 3